MNTRHEDKLQAKVKAKLEEIGFTRALYPDQLEVLGLAAAQIKAGERPLIRMPTGGGKTILAAAMFAINLDRTKDKTPPGKALFVVDRKTITRQALRSIKRSLGETLCADVVRLDGKRLNWNAQIIIATRQTLEQPRTLKQLEAQEFTFIIADEAHRCGSPSYIAVMDAAMKNSPSVRVVGLSATPARTDGKPLYPFTCHVSGPTLTQMIALSRLCPPRILAPAVEALESAQSDLKRLADSGQDHNLEAASLIVDKTECNAGIVQEWKRRAGDRVTVVFSCTIQHAENLNAAFQTDGVQSVTYHSRMKDADKQQALEALEAGKVQVIVTPLSLTEGFDHQPLSCVVLARPFHSLPALTQAIGRGLRIVDADEYPDHASKKDCIVLDFAGAVLRHGRIDTPPAIHGRPTNGDSDSATFTACPACDALIPSTEDACPECGEPRPVKAQQEHDDHAAPDLVDITDLISASPFQWLSIAKHDAQGEPYTLAANAQDAAAVVFRSALDNEGFEAFVRKKPRNTNWRRGDPHQLCKGTLAECVTASNAYLEAYGDPATGTNRPWQQRQATPNQRAQLRNKGIIAAPTLKAGEASALLQAAYWKGDICRISGRAMLLSGRHVEPFNPLGFNREHAA